jgi:hypothetical protein
MKSLTVLVSIGLCLTVHAQDSATLAPKALSFSAYAEGYVGHDFGSPEDGLRPAFLYSFNRHGSARLNLGFVKASYTKEGLRANLALAAGTYMKANYASEPGVLGHLLEANLGFRLDKAGLWWIDLGVIPSHIGFETAIGRDNPTLTRSLVAENSPYFETGAKLGYTTEKGDWQFALLALNGWQRIRFRRGYPPVSLGTQVTYKPSERVTLNYSTFLGSDTPDTARLFRHYHNVYGIFNLNARLSLTAGIDLGREEKHPTGMRMNTWVSPVAILRYSPTEKWAMAFRAEYYGDTDGVIIDTGTPNGFRTRGLSLNIDHMPLQKVMLRIEGRLFNSRDEIFMRNGQPDDRNTSVVASACIAL